MDFFSAKADALRRSRRLEWLFALAVTTCVGVLTLFTLFQLALQRHGSGSAEDPGPEALALIRPRCPTRDEPLHSAPA